MAYQKTSLSKQTAMKKNRTQTPRVSSTETSGMKMKKAIKRTKTK